MPTFTVSKRLTLFLLLLLVAILTAGVSLNPSGAALAQEGPERQGDGSDEEENGERPLPQNHAAPRAPAQLNIICFSTEVAGSACARIETLFDSVTTIHSLDAFPADLSPYDVFYLSNDEGDALASKAAALQSYVNGGGGLVVSQPNIEGEITLFPPGFEMYVSNRGYTGADEVALTPAGQGHPIMAGLAVGDLSGNYETVPLDRVGPGWTTLVKAADRPLLALAAGQYGSGRMAFHTGNIKPAAFDPGSDAYVQQLIEWTGTAVAPGGPDMRIEAIEVTQAVQDLNNSVLLVADKRTYVRVHVSSPTYMNDVFANLSGERDGVRLFPTLAPGNPGADIRVLTFPDREQINDSFWFELPESWIGAGPLTLTATLDPAAAKGDPDYSNNSQSVTVNFAETAPLRLRLFDVRYSVGSNTYTAGASHMDQLETWLEAAYPIPGLDGERRLFTYPEEGLPDVDDLHGYLALGKLLGILFAGEDSEIVYYGMVDDGGGFMRGKALDIPSTIAAGPTGDTDFHGGEDYTWGWDYDGSYGDWYGGHELGHTQGRWHAEYCGARDGQSYPYALGRISPALSGDGALYGFDIRDRSIYGPEWRDVMTYCDNQWVSDFTYEGIHAHLTGARPPQRAVSADQFVVVVASVDLETHAGAIDDLYLLAQTATIPAPEPGDWTLLLLDAEGNTLATHPVEAHKLTASESVPGTPAIIAASVPAVEGLQRVEIRYGGKTVDTREMSPNPPGVTITSPQTQDEFGSGDLLLSWEGKDPDGDKLTYSVFYSQDGFNWTPLSTGLPAEQLSLPTSRLPGGSAFLKVVASDGMRTGSDTVGPFFPPGHAPEVEIVSPADGATFWPAQLVVLRADVYDLEENSLSGDQIQWRSSLDGDLGTGVQLSSANLSTGVHTITAEATDSSNRTGQAQITIEVFGGDAPEPLNLQVVPDVLAHTAYTDTLTAGAYALSVRSSSGVTATWSAQADAAWVDVGPASGQTPGSLTVTIDPAGLEVGDYQGTITVTSGEAENSPLVIPVSLTVAPAPGGSDVYLPLVVRPPA